MSSAETNEPSTKKVVRRAGRPKVKTGCFTCKIRHVKCDERKPSCQRCTSTGRQCDGYPGDTAIQERQARTFCYPQKVPLSITSSDRGSLQDIRAASYFRECIATTFSSHQFEKAFWNYLVPQLSSALLMVRAATSALASLHEIQNASSAIRQSETVGSSFLRHYDTAVRKLREQINVQPHGPVPLLVTCVLLLCVDLLRDEPVNALMHLEGGFSVLQAAPQYRKVYSILEHDERSAKLTTQTSEDELVVLFRRFDMQTSSFLTARPPTLPVCAASNVNISMVQNSFLGLRQAFCALTNLMHACYVYTSTVSRWKYKPRTIIPRALYVEGQRYLTLLERWLLMFSQTVGDTIPITTPDTHASAMSASVLQINCHSTYIYTSCILEPFEISYDQHLARFSDIVMQSSKVLEHRSRNLNTTRSPAFFTPELGVIQPLYLTATRCRNLIVRQNAVSLLYHAGREGPWNGFVESQVARKAIEVEAHLAGSCADKGTSDIVPEVARLHGIGLETSDLKQTGKMTLFFSCFTEQATSLASADRYDYNARPSVSHTEIDLSENRYWRRWSEVVDLSTAATEAKSKASPGCTRRVV